MDYRGFITLEPHLDKGGQFGGSTSGKNYTFAIEATREMAKMENLNLE